jgi:two-component system, sensor histidine kinase
MGMTKSRKTAAARARKRAAPRRARRAAPSRDRHPAVEAALAALAHDIRTPLNGILALTELLAASELGERERGWANAVKSAAEHLSRYTTVVCDAVRSEAVGLMLRQDRFSPRALAQTLAASLSARAATIGLKTEIAIPDDLPNVVIGDPVRLRAALENLIDNAVKFTARGGIAFAVAAKPGGRKHVQLYFSVTDSGIGLKPEEIKKLFRPFAQASEAVARRYGGAGLGLTLVKRLAKAMGGDLTVTSKPGRGSTFWLSVKVQGAKGEAEGESQNATEAVAATGDGLSVLCVEDNPYGRVVMNTILSGLGHRADFAGSGEAAIEAVRRGGYDLVLMDMTLPGMNGAEAALRIGALPGTRIPIIGISGHDSAGDERAARAAGIDLYLSKPVAPATLAQAIRKVVAK